MKNKDNNEIFTQLDELCNTIKILVSKNEFDNCEKIIYQAMEKFPHAPHPHNLLGIVLEKKGNHSQAMKHFRAAGALDPTYLPANHNLLTYGSFFSYGCCAFSERDIPKNIIQ